MRRSLALLGRQLLAEAASAGPAGAPSTSGRGELASWAAAAGRQRWFSAGASAAAAAAAGGASACATAAVAHGGRGPPTGLRKLRLMMQNYKQLSKMRLSLLVVATSAAGYAAGSGDRIDWAGMGWTSLGTMLASSSANALNQVYEKVNDGLMKRTMNRPLPTGRMSRPHALAFAAACGLGGVWLLADKTNLTTAALGAANIVLYAGVYTPLKQISVVNTWVGAIVGAVPPLMGWAAATGGLDVGAAILGAGLYFWQMPHFMALAWMCKADYTAGGYRMLSMIDATGRRTAACALRNCLYLFPLGALATWLGVTSPYFAYESAFITGGMMLTAARFYSSPTVANARILFRASLLHLPLFMAAFLVHRLPNHGEDKAALLMHNARLLGLGGSVEQRQPGKQHEEEEGALAALTRVRLSLPPLPFLPSLPLAVSAQLSCPSKAACEEAQPQQQEGEGKEEAEEEGGGEGAAPAAGRA
ncbi:Protoheme IX mitochondrial [Chlorella sorokiniana]|jgi:protoheme IX farnesyltransferase|uniref:Heme O synthase n=1 Tax=Chlorella sorokiniana TaxID=3076 RepID=A0A2P6TKE6_CHLSO|nr:Protoheme IX mitochondrial [Chlorella sorokiniana]|eukprot:PRW44545.1 Protoheme IX mitochondrial [Chlorella sorokiniana]